MEEKGLKMWSNVAAPDHQWRNLPNIEHLKPLGLERPVPEQTCYRNALFILLVHTPVFLNKLQDLAALCSSREGHNAKCCTLCTFKKIAELFWSERDPNKQKLLMDNSKHIWERVCRSEWKVNEQYDLMEFFERFLLQLDEDSILALDLLSTLFRAQYSTHKMCERCGKAGISEGEYLHYGMSCYPLSVAPDEQQVNYQELISNNLKSEYRKGYKCDNEDCGATGRTSFTIRLENLPEVFLMHINTRSSSYNPKMKHLMPIQLGEFLTLSSAGGQTAQYELYAAVSHLGGSKFGHYVATVKAPSGNWVHFDDEERREVNLEELQEWQTVKSGRTRPQTLCDWTIYMLAFRKVDMQDPLGDIFVEAQEILGMSAVEEDASWELEALEPPNPKKEDASGEERTGLEEERLPVTADAIEAQPAAKALQDPEPEKDICVWVQGTVKIDDKLLSGTFLDQLRLPVDQKPLLADGGPRFRGQRVQVAIALWEKGSIDIADGELIGRVKRPKIGSSKEVQPHNTVNNSQKSAKFKAPPKTRKPTASRKRALDDAQDDVSNKGKKRKPPKRRKRN